MDYQLSLDDIYKTFGNIIRMEQLSSVLIHPLSFSLFWLAAFEHGHHACVELDAELHLRATQVTEQEKRAKRHSHPATPVFSKPQLL